MNEQTKKLCYNTEPVREIVRHFVMEPNAYYGVTRSGFLFNIINCRSITPHIKDEADYHTYLWLECTNGSFILRQRFIDGLDKSWYIEAEIIPCEKYLKFFEEMGDFLEENPDTLEEICGIPHTDEEE